MASRQDYLTRLQIAVQELYKRGAVHRQSVPVHEQLHGHPAWRGWVEVFDLNGHPKAKCCYAWNHRGEENDEHGRFVTVLEIPPVVGPATAVQAAIANEVKKTP